MQRELQQAGFVDVVADGEVVVTQKPVYETTVTNLVGSRMVAAEVQRVTKMGLRVDGRLLRGEVVERLPGDDE